MKVFVAGASGALGVQLVPELVAAGHEVVAMTRTPAKQDMLRTLGARPVVADALDPDAVARVVGEAEPEVIVHQLTALSGRMGLRDARHPDRSPMAITTNRLRTEATDYLLAAGRGRRGPAVRCAELRRLPLRPHRPAGDDRGRAPVSRSPRSAAPGGASAAPPGEGGDLDRLGRGPRAALRRVLRPGHRDQPRPRRRDGRPRPQAAVPDHRRRRRRVVAHPHRGRRGRDGHCGRARRPEASTTSSTTSPPPCGTGCRRWRARSTPSPRGASRGGSGASWPARWRPS